MKTISCPFILTIIGVGMNLTFGIQVSSINCGDVCSAEEGSPYNMTCSWTGSLTTGILWSNGVNNILTCNPAGQCLEFDDKYAKGNYYPNGTTALITILSYNPSTDAVAWTCRDGSDDPLYCTLPRPAIGTLQGNCTKDGNRYDLTCSGLTDHGTPAVELQIKLNGVVKARNSTGGSVSSSTGEAGESYTCEVSGEAACLASAPFQCEICVCDVACTYVGGVLFGLGIGSYVIYTILILVLRKKITVLQIFFVVTMIFAGAAIIGGGTCTGVTVDKKKSCEGQICDTGLGLSAASLVAGIVVLVIKIFIQGMVMDSAGVSKRSLLGNFLHFPREKGEGNLPSGANPDAPTNTPATVETIGESSSGNSRGTRNQETVLLTNKTTNSQETDERKDGNKATPAEYGNMNMNIPALGLQSNQGKAQTGDGNGGQTGNETSKSEKGEKKKGSKKKKSKKKKEKQDGSQSPPAVSVSGVAVDDPKMVAEPEEQIRSDPNLTKVVG